MSDVIKYPLSAAIELCEQLDNDQTNYYLKMLEYKRERDEAREALEHVKEYGTEEINAAVELRQKLAQVLVERDEAIAALMRIEDLFIDGTDIYADREKMGTIARNALEGAK